MWRLSLLLPLLLTPGCYLTHVAAGQFRLLQARQPIKAVLEDETTPADVRESLSHVQDARRYARSLGLTIDNQYTTYVAWPGDRIVTTVVATRPVEVEPAGFWFPILGTLPYKGFFDPERAEREAERLRGQGLDVCIVPVRAYSTLGWFDDPVTEPMLHGGTGALVETILHELVHATVYVREQIDFNEGVASFIGEEASVRFYQDRGETNAADQRRQEVADARSIDAAILRFRERVIELYAAEPAGPERDAARANAEQETRAAIAATVFETRDANQLSQVLRLNDACLALAATYTADLDRYARRLRQLDGDLSAFVSRLIEAAQDPEPRNALLESH